MLLAGFPMSNVINVCLLLIYEWKFDYSWRIRGLENSSAQFASARKQFICLLYILRFSLVGIGVVKTQFDRTTAMLRCNVLWNTQSLAWVFCRCGTCKRNWAEVELTFVCGLGGIVLQLYCVYGGSVMEIASINYEMMQMPVERCTSNDWKCWGCRFFG